MIINNNRNYNFKGIIDNYDFSHNRAAIIWAQRTDCVLYETEEVECARESTSISLILPIAPSLNLSLLTTNCDSWEKGTSGHPVPNPSVAKAIVSDH